MTKKEAGITIFGVVFGILIILTLFFGIGLFISEYRALICGGKI
jgi:hypothetical protein